jgi:hypothetical protein
METVSGKYWIRYDMLCDMLWYDICLLTAVGLTPSGSSTVHIYTQTMHRTNKQYMEQTIKEQTIYRTNRQYIEQKYIEQTNNSRTN